MQQLLPLNIDLISVEEHLLKAHGLKHVLNLRALDSDTSTALSHCVTLVGLCFCFDTLGLDCLNNCRLSNFCMGSISVYFRHLIAEVSAVIHVSPGWE